MSEFINTSEIMGGDDAVLDALIARELVELKDDSIKQLRPHALYYNNIIATVDLPNLEKIGTSAFQNCVSLEKAEFDLVTSVGGMAFGGCTSLTNVSLKKLKSALPGSTFSNCKKLKNVDLPEVTALYSGCFSDCASLQIKDDIFLNVTRVESSVFSNVPSGVIPLPKCDSLDGYIATSDGPEGFDFSKKINFQRLVFGSNYNLIHLLLRSDELCSCVDSPSLFVNTPIAKGYGHIYVPDILINAYKESSAWAAYSQQFARLSEYPLEPGTIQDTWEQIFESEQNGTYKTKYAVGDSKLLYISGNPVLMIIVAIDADILASDHSKTAPITWMSAGCMFKSKISDTGTDVGWNESVARQFLRNEVYSEIDYVVRSNIKEVSKTYYTNAPTAGISEIADTIWIPSHREVFGSDSYESSGPTYSDVFTDQSERTRYTGKYGVCIPSTAWWLRTASKNSYRNMSIDTGGNETSTAIQANTYSLLFGFCT